MEMERETETLEMEILNDDGIASDRHNDDDSSNGENKEEEEEEEFEEFFQFTRTGIVPIDACAFLELFAVSKDDFNNRKSFAGQFQDRCLDFIPQCSSPSCLPERIRKPLIILLAERLARYDGDIDLSQLSIGASGELRERTTQIAHIRQGEINILQHCLAKLSS